MSYLTLNKKFINVCYLVVGRLSVDLLQCIYGKLGNRSKNWRKKYVILSIHNLFKGVVKEAITNV